MSHVRLVFPPVLKNNSDQKKVVHARTWGITQKTLQQKHSEQRQHIMAFIESILEQHRADKLTDYIGTDDRYHLSISKYWSTEEIQSFFDSCISNLASQKIMIWIWHCRVLVLCINFWRWMILLSNRENPYNNYSAYYVRIIRSNAISYTLVFKKKSCVTVVKIDVTLPIYFYFLWAVAV